MIFSRPVDNSLSVGLHQRNSRLTQLADGRRLAHGAAAVGANAAPLRLAYWKAAAAPENIAGQRAPATLPAVGMSDLFCGCVCAAASPQAISPVQK